MALISGNSSPFVGPDQQTPVGIGMIDDRTGKPVIVYASDMALRKLEPEANDDWMAIFSRHRADIEAAARRKFDFGVAGRTITILSHEV